MATTAPKRPRKVKTKVRAKPGGRKSVAALSECSRDARTARRLAQKDAAFAVVAHITSRDSAEYRKNNPVPPEFWAEPTAE